MSSLTPLLPKGSNPLPNTAIFLSGSGSNAERILLADQARLAAGETLPYKLCALVTDAPKTSRALELGEKFGLPVISEDIRAFYQAHGESRVTIRSAKAQQLRQQWSECLRQKLLPYKLDFAVFAGFVPLTNITADFPCLNVHPGDLTYLKDGQRLLVGLHQIPVELAILEGLDYMRSSVILAQPYTGQGEDMDSGAILGISPEVTIDLQGEDLEELRQCAEARPAARPVGGYKDRLAELATLNLERLKQGGDWVVLPGVMRDFAQGRYAVDEHQRLHYKAGSKFLPVQTVQVNEKQRELIFSSDL
ncbi:MAG: hypothetical protein GX946_04675 [Oligosphaeraceae bacterium]|nr:hypothetical protein [Oligosphaeraceae bacterium]